MFKALTPFRVKRAEPIPADELGALFQTLPFVPCGPTQAKSVGFVPPRGHEHGALIEVVGDAWIAKVVIEKRVVPGAVVKRRVDEMAAKIAAETGRKVGAKRRRELKEEALLDLLPQAFTRQASAFVWLSTGRGLMLIGSTSNGVLDDVLSLVSKADSARLMIEPVITKKSPAAFMASLLLGGDDADESSFFPGREAVLVAPSLDGATVRFSKHSLAGESVREHLVGGKVVKSLALLHDSGEVEFTLDDSLRLKKIEIENSAPLAGDKEVDPFDADVAISTGLLGPALDCLIVDLGGFADLGEVPK